MTRICPGKPQYSGNSFYFVVVSPLNFGFQMNVKNVIKIVISNESKKEKISGQSDWKVKENKKWEWERLFEYIVKVEKSTNRNAQNIEATVRWKRFYVLIEIFMLFLPCFCAYVWRKLAKRNASFYRSK